MQRMKENIEVANANNNFAEKTINKMSISAIAFMTGAAGSTSILELTFQGGNIILGTVFLTVSVGGAVATVAQIIRPVNR